MSHLRISKLIAKSEEAAQRLTTVGMSVNVQKDNGDVVESKLLSLPWKLGHGHWVAKVEGFSGGFDCNRITLPLEV